MGNKRSVMVYGDSLILSGIAASLENESHITVHQIRVHASTDGRDRDLAERITRQNPDALIFDLAVTPADFIVDLAGQHPELLLVGVAPDTGYMLHLRGYETEALTLHGLVHTIKRRSPHSPFPGWAGRFLDRLPAVHIPALTKRRVLVAAFLGLTGLLLALHMPFDYEAQLAGVAFDSGLPPRIWLAFAGGVVLGGALIWAWLRWGKGRKIH
jgi:hypothetical protein